MRPIVLTLIVFLALTLQARPVAAQPVTQGAEFQVNTHTTDGSSSAEPGLAVDSDGNFIVTWAAPAGVLARKFDPDGAPLDSDMLLELTDPIAKPLVASNGEGRFVVIGQLLSDGDTSGVGGRRFAGDGSPLGADFQVNTFTTDRQHSPQVASDAQGRFVVVWPSYGQDHPDATTSGIFGQRFDSNGDRLGDEFQVNSFTTGKQTSPGVGVGPDGAFVVAWHSFGQGGFGADIFAQRFDSSGTAVGGEFQVNTYTGGDQFTPTVGLDSEGDFVIAWGSFVSFESGFDVLARRYAGDGTSQGDPFLVNSYTTDGQSSPTLAMSGDGTFTVVWSSSNQDGDGLGVFGRTFLGDGEAFGDEFQVNTHTAYNQSSRTVAVRDDRYMVVWNSFLQDGDGNGLFAQLYRGPIFTNDFESGTMSAWSAVAP